MLRRVLDRRGFLVFAVAVVAAAGITVGVISGRPVAARGRDQALPGTTACTSTAAAGRSLRPPQPVFALGSLPSSPYAVAATSTHAFVSYPSGYHQDTGLISVLDLHGSTATLARTVQVPGEPFGIALSTNDRYLLVANYLGGLEILSTAALESGSGQVVVAQLASAGQGSDEVALTPDDGYAFVPEEESSAIAVYDLGGLLTGIRGAQPRQVGSIPVGESPSDAVLAPDGRTLYVISQGSGTAAGMLYAISVRVGEQDPAHAILQQVDAGCDPVRVAIAPSGVSAWVTDRGGDSVLAFTLAPGPGRPVSSMLAAVRVGSEPVGAAFVDSGAVLAVTDSARSDEPGQDQTIAIISTADALARQPALTGFLPAGAFPRQFGQAPGGPLLFTDFNSDDVRLISTSDLSWLQEQNSAS
jgi:DNA-binding beta-propeller fold protein YncE